MRALTIDDPGTFLREAGALLADAGRHNLIVGITGTLIAHPDMYPTFHLWVVKDGARPVAAALLTEPYKLVLADPIDEEAFAPLASAVKRSGAPVPGLVANEPWGERFAARWQAETGMTARLVMRQGVYALTSVRDVRSVSGAARPATSGDRGLVRAWITAFSEEVFPDERHHGPQRDRERLERDLDRRLGDDERSGFWLWEDGEPVSISGHNEVAAGVGARIGPVYTPVKFRRRGYASNLVREQSVWLLESGRPSCFLYTDLGNPTSNRIYMDIGYELVCESAEFTFDPKI
jgi:predicted GNAT family acetyltransferase